LTYAQSQNRIAIENTNYSVPIIGFEVKSYLASAYFFRGENIYGKKLNNDLNGVFSPSFSLVIIPASFSITYESFYQISGDNAAYNVNIGKGHQQNIIIHWDYFFVNRLEISSFLGYYFFPFAQKEIAGIKNPSYLDVIVNSFWHSKKGLTTGIGMAYLFGVQNVISDMRYLYIYPSVKQKIEFG
jgi:hypothetical protein